QCNDGTFTLNANAPSVGTGQWTVVSGVANIVNASSFNTTVTVVPVGTNAVLRWTISNGTCTATTDEVTLSNHALPTPTLVSDLGNTICAGETVTFTASGGTSYEFFVNGVSVQADGPLDTYTTSA